MRDTLIFVPLRFCWETVLHWHFQTLTPEAAGRYQSAVLELGEGIYNKLPTAHTFQVLVFSQRCNKWIEVGDIKYIA